MEDDRTNALRIKRQCNPEELQPEVMAELERVVHVEARATSKLEARTLTKRLLRDTYADMDTLSEHDKCFDGAEEFMRAMKDGVRARAQEIGHDRLAENRLPYRFGDDGPNVNRLGR